MDKRKEYHWDRPRLVLHFGFATCILLQLLSSQFMHGQHGLPPTPFKVPLLSCTPIQALQQPC